MGTPHSNSAKIKLVRYLLTELRKNQEENFEGFDREKLADVIGTNDKKRIAILLREVCRGMFDVSGGFVLPKYEDFGGRDEFLKELALNVSTVENVTHMEGLGKKSTKDFSSHMHEGSFAHTRGRRS